MLMSAHAFCILCVPNKSTTTHDLCMLCVPDTMTPIPEDEIVFIGDVDKYGNKKGVTVAQFRTDIRISLWYFVKKDEGYITPQRRGISLTSGEYNNLKGSFPEIDSKIAQLSASAIDSFLCGVKSKSELEALRRKLDDVEKGMGPDMIDYDQAANKKKKSKNSTSA